MKTVLKKTVGLLMAVMMIGSMLVCSVSAAEVHDETQLIVEGIEELGLEELEPTTDEEPVAAIAQEK